MRDVSRQEPDRDRLKPQRSVSFNRDVHVKRIVSDVGSPLVVGALAGDGAGRLVATPVRRERLGHLSREQLAQEAAKVLDQADKVHCQTTKGSLPDKFYTLPARRKHRRGSTESQDNVNLLSRRHSDELTSQSPPRKPPRTFATSTPKNNNNTLTKLFKKSDKEQKSNIKRSLSDASNSKSKSLDLKLRRKSESEIGESGHVKTKKSQLSPIIEVVPREDYFSKKENVNKGINTNTRQRKKWNKPKLSSNEFKNVKNELNNTSRDSPEIVIIDVEKAENIERKPKKFNATSLKNKLKSLSFKKDNKKPKNDYKPKTNSNTTKEIIKTKSKTEVDNKDLQPPVNLTHIGIEVPKSPLIQEAIKSLEQQIQKSPEMIHSSQKPPEKLPLTKGRKVDTMVKRLSIDKSFMPPKTNIMVTPSTTVQHNNNQPFSYTRGLSPERPSRTKSPSSPVIYAQVVVGNGDPDNPRPNKQTIHTVYNGKKHLPHSDSDEGLGYEESGFGRKYDNEKSYTHFGEDKNDFYKDIDKFDEEFPITPKFKSVGNYTNGYSYNEFSKNESNFVDSSVRGRGDGMDARRRESLSEFPLENGKLNGSPSNLNGRSDLSYRRDLLESRINSRKFGDRTTLNRSSPDRYSPKVEKHVMEKNISRFYRRGSSPIGQFTEEFTKESKVNRVNDQFVSEARKTKYDEYSDYPSRFDNEPKSLDSQASDYRSSPENLNTRKSYFVPRSDSPQAFKTIYTNKYKKSDRSSKERDHYKSNPEINYNYDDRRFVSETFHDSLRRQKSEDSPKHKEKYFDSIEERKDKFGDSGIENDFRRDSGERIRNGVKHYRTRELSNESEDEGFASSLLIASERQHTEDNNIARNLKIRREYDSDREVRGYASNKETDYRSYENGEHKRSVKHEYVPRERSIDDGSHYDPRIDKDFDKDKTLKKVEKKPPKPQKKSSLEKVKSLFTRDSSKKKREKDEPLRMVREESLRARYREYKGGINGLRTSSRKESDSDNLQIYDYSNRRRLSTPSPSPSRENSARRNEKESASWFKSLDSRLSRKKDKAPSTRDILSEDEKPSKNLRFFGDTDIESNDSVRYKTTLKPSSATRTPRSRSTQHLHNISEERYDSDLGASPKRPSAYKSLQNVSLSAPGGADTRRGSLKPPASPARRPSGDVTRGKRKKNEVSSVGSSEGDSSQQSQRSVVYLHAATVGDIPDPNFISRSRKAASREELTSLGSSRMQPQVKTLSRSFSMLAPWKPRNPSDAYNIDYTNYQSRPLRTKASGKTAKERSNKKLSENRKSNQNLSTLSRRSKSKENVSTLSRNKEDIPKSTSTTLYKKKERSSKENSRYSKDDRKLSNKSMSVESLGHGRSKESNVSRSVSMPRDPEKQAGWFKMNKTNNKKTIVTQRL